MRDMSHATTYRVLENPLFIAALVASPAVAGAQGSEAAAAQAVASAFLNAKQAGDWKAYGSRDATGCRRISGQANERSPRIDERPGAGVWRWYRRLATRPADRERRRAIAAASCPALVISGGDANSGCGEDTTGIPGMPVTRVHTVGTVVDDSIAYTLYDEVDETRGVMRPVALNEDPMYTAPVRILRLRRDRGSW
jgi:hypothetical protein